MEATPNLGAKLKDTSQELFGFKTYLRTNRCFSFHSLLCWPSIQGTSRSQVVTKRFTRRKPFSCSSRRLGSLFPVGKKKPSRIVANLLWNLLQFGQSFSCWYLLRNSSDIDSAWPKAPVHLRDRNSIRSLKKLLNVKLLQMHTTGKWVKRCMMFQFSKLDVFMRRIFVPFHHSLNLLWSISLLQVKILTSGNLKIESGMCIQRIHRFKCLLSTGGLSKSIVVFLYEYNAYYIYIVSLYIYILRICISKMS